MIDTSAIHSTTPLGTDFLPGPILLLGAPGAGKSTQAHLLVSKYGIPQISTGELLRGNITRKTELGLKAKESMRSGHLVDDDVVNRMVLERLLEKDTDRGSILDGYPRTLEQARFLDRKFADPIFQRRLPVIAISIVVSYDRLLKRITGRRVCPACKNIYNIYLDPSGDVDHCELDGSKLVHRTDDTKSVFTERMKIFAEQTAPVVAHYRNLGRFEEADGDQGVEAVFAAIEQAIVKLRHASH